MSTPVAHPEHEFAQLFQAHPLPMLVYDRQTLALLEVNGALVQQYGWEREQLLRMRLVDLRPESELPTMLQLTAQPAESPRTLGLVRHRTQAGELLDVEITARDLEYAGRPARLVLCRNVTSELRAQAVQRLLARASAAFSSSLDVDATLAGIPQLVVPELADLCVVFVLGDDARLRLLAAAHRDPARQSLLGQVGAAFAPALDDPVSVVARVVRTGQAVISEPPRPGGLLSEAGRAVEQAAAELGATSFLIAPLVGRGGAMGAITFGQTDPDRRFQPDHVDLARELGRRAGMALENARLYRAAQEELEQRRAAEQLSKEAEERYRALFQRSQDSVWVYGLDGSFIDANDAALALLGYTREEMKQLAFSHMVRTDDLARVQEVFAKAARLEEEPGYSEYVSIRKDGSEVTVEAKAVPLLRDGQPYALIGIARDLTERRRAGQADSRLAAIVESSQDAIFGTDLEGIVTSWNAGAERMMGYAAHEIIGRPFFILVPEERMEGAHELLARASAGERVARVVIPIRKDGSRGRMSLTVAPTSDHAGHVTGVGFIGHDESERMELQQQLAQAHKLEAIGRLAGGVAHDFNNILTSVKGHVGFLLEALAPGDPRREDAAEVDRAADRAQSLTRQLLAFGRRQVLQPRELDLNGVVMEMGAMLRRLLGEDIELRTQLARDLGPVRADPGQLQQVLLNLAVNARDAMPQGGRLVIATDQRLLADDSAGALPSGRYVSLAVSDDGVGIDADVLPHIFEPFFTTKDAGRGTGLGLATVYGIVTQSGGAVFVESEPGHGSTFTVLLPEAVPGAAPPAVEPAAVPAPRPPRGRTILLVEDEHAVRQVALRALLAAGYRVLPAPDGETALDLARDHDGRIDLLVTDVVLPGIGGRMVAETLVAARPGLPTLFISGYAEDAVLRREAGQPGVHFLEKPFAPGELCRKVGEVLAPVS